MKIHQMKRIKVLLKKNKKFQSEETKMRIECNLLKMCTFFQESEGQGKTRLQTTTHTLASPHKPSQALTRPRKLSHALASLRTPSQAFAHPRTHSHNHAHPRKLSHALTCPQPFLYTKFKTTLPTQKNSECMFYPYPELKKLKLGPFELL